MIYPDKENTIALLGDWAMQYAAVSRLMVSMNSTIGLDSAGPLYEVVWKLFDAYTGALSVEVGDFGGWLEWFQSENEMGKRGRGAGYDEKVKPIKTLTHLYALIAESRKRGSAAVAWREF